MARITACQCVFLSCVLVAFARTVGAAEVDDLLEFLVAENEAARERIQTFDVDYTFVRAQDVEGVIARMPPDAVLSENNAGMAELLARTPDLVVGTATVIVDGERRWHGHDFQTSLGDNLVEQRGMRSLINDDYVGYYPAVGGPLAYQREIVSPVEMDDDTAFRSYLGSPLAVDLFQFGFNAGRGSAEPLRDSLEANPDPTLIEVEHTTDEEGTAVYVVREYAGGEQNEAYLSRELFFEPDAGYLITRVNGYTANGELNWSTRVRPQEIQPGVWFPMEIEEHTNMGDFYIAIDRIVVNAPIDPSQFELLSLGFDPVTTTVLHEPLTGEVTVMYFDGKEFIPTRPGVKAMPSSNDDNSPPKAIDAKTEDMISTSPGSGNPEGNVSRSETVGVKMDTDEPAATRGRNLSFISFLGGIVAILIAAVLFKLSRH